MLEIVATLVFPLSPTIQCAVTNYEIKLMGQQDINMVGIISSLHQGVNS